MIQLSDDISNEELLDSILKEAIEGYGDLVSAAKIHGVSVKTLQARIVQLHNMGAVWIS